MPGSIGLLFGSHTQRKRNLLFSPSAKASLTLNISKNQAEFNEMRQTLHFVINYYLPIILLLCVIPVITDIHAYPSNLCFMQSKLPTNLLVVFDKNISKKQAELNEIQYRSKVS